jgi:hypothetical protein
MAVPLYNTLIDHIEDIASMDNIEPEIVEAAVSCRDKLIEYYNKTNKTCLIATILDPRLKLQYYKDNNWGEEMVTDVYNM